MTDIRKRTIITLFILGAVISFLVLFAIKPIFGQIKTDGEIRVFMNTEIAKDTGREVINEQKI